MATTFKTKQAFVDYIINKPEFWTVSFDELVNIRGKKVRMIVIKDKKTGTKLLARYNINGTYPVYWQVLVPYDYFVTLHKSTYRD